MLTLVSLMNAEGVEPQGTSRVAVDLRAIERIAGIQALVHDRRETERPNQILDLDVSK
jgi:hypothetical protein